MRADSKPKLLAVELWALGDLALATPFLNAAASQFEVTLLAKPAAIELRPRFFPRAEVIPFTFPWTAFRGKYRLHRWPWNSWRALVGELRRRRFDWAVSSRWDPRDHLVLRMSGATRRAGFPRLGSGVFLTQSLVRPGPEEHRYENWRVLAKGLGLELPAVNKMAVGAGNRAPILIHCGAAQPTKQWPLERFQFVAAQLRRSGHAVRIACDAHQRQWWLDRGEEVCVPGSVTELIQVLDEARLLIGNDSGPGHLAAIMGIPTFTLFGNQTARRFAPLHPRAEWMEGADCPYKPCYDSCRFARPECLLSLSENAVWPRVKDFVARNQSAS